MELEDQPIKFNLQAAGNVSGSDLYKNIVLSDITITKDKMNGSLFNSGLQEITVPQLLVSYYDENKMMIWVDHIFIKKGIRQQRKQDFEYTFISNSTFKIINNSMKNIYVNGLPNEPISNKIVPNRIENHLNLELQHINHPNFSYIKIETNAYIGNPN
ncbi:MAG: hypothetical protein ACI9YE_002185 [Psychroserpens sp.]